MLGEHLKRQQKTCPKWRENAGGTAVGHTPETAEKHYRMRTPADAFLAQGVLDQLAGKTRYASNNRDDPYS